MEETRTVLFPIDFTPLSHLNLSLAVEMCQRFGARLVIHHNQEGRPPGFLAVQWMWSEDHQAENEEQGKILGERIGQIFSSIPVGIEYEAKLTRGPIDECLLYLAKILPAGLIVMGTHGPSSTDHESLTEKIIIRAPCTVLTTGESYRPETVFGVGKDKPEHMTMLVPYDFSSRSRACLEETMAMTRHMPHRIHLLHVVASKGRYAAESSEPATILELREKLIELVPEELEDRIAVDVVVGRPVERIIETAREIEALFILMAAHSKSPLERLLFGTTTLGVLHGADCPVWFMSAAAQRHRPDRAA